MSAQNDLIPFWGHIDTTMDWCEPNYTTSRFLAETFNALSSIPIIIFGLIGISAYWRNCHNERRLLLVFLAYTAVGIGSTLFHGTLRRSAQVLDELPMLFVNFICIYMLIERHKHNRYRYLSGCLITMALFTTLVYLFTDHYWFFITTFICQTTYVTLKSFQISQRLWHLCSSYRLCAMLFTASYLLYFSAISLWLVDIFMCPYVQPMHLHSFWHILSGLATFIWIQFQIGIRGLTIGREIHLKPSLLPVISYGAHLKHEA